MKISDQIQDPAALHYETTPFCPLEKKCVSSARNHITTPKPSVRLPRLLIHNYMQQSRLQKNLFKIFQEWVRTLKTLKVAKVYTEIKKVRNRMLLVRLVCQCTSERKSERKIRV
jgi:hypothetical protein